MFTDMSKVFITKLVIVLGLSFSGCASARTCMTPAPVDGLLSVSYPEPFEDQDIFVRVTSEVMYDGAKFLDMNFIRTQGKLTLFHMPVKTSVTNGLVQANFFSNIKELENWHIIAYYGSDDKSMHCNIKYSSKTSLKHNKVKNENASKAGTDAAKTRRPF